MGFVERIIICVAFIAIAAATAAGQTSAAKPNVDELTRRIEELEQKVNMLAAELARRQTPPVQSHTEATTAVSETVTAKPELDPQGTSLLHARLT